MKKAKREDPQPVGAIRAMTYEDWRDGCDLSAGMYVHARTEKTVREEIRRHREHVDGDVYPADEFYVNPDGSRGKLRVAAGSPIPPPYQCGTWLAARAWSDAIEARISECDTNHADSIRHLG